LSDFLSSRGDFVTHPKKRKTYRRFLGMIFFGEVCALFVADWQRVAKEKITKK
jgi:hypothetical protein